MKTILQKIITDALIELDIEGLVIPSIDEIQIDKAKDSLHGDFATNIAMMLSKQARLSPRELADQILEQIPDNEQIEKIEVAGPGFINFFLKKDAYISIVKEILKSGKNYGRSDYGQGKRILVEFVSANPTGPLHIGHGRGAAYGDILSNLLEAVGFKVDREYYINDAGRQIDILTVSIWLRYLEVCDVKIKFPENAYQGNYIKDIALDLHKRKKDDLVRQLDMDEISDKTDPDSILDQVITDSRAALGTNNYEFIRDLGLETIIDDIRKDLEYFGVVYSNWFSELSLSTEDKINQSIEVLKSSDHVYMENGAYWFKSSDYGDEKDRVLIRENGQYTYFTSDIAYHKTKLDRDYDALINIWGADHHGYVPRIKAVLKALGENSDKLNILLVQFASLYRGKEKVQMSTRSGQYITLRELIDEVGKDATRFFYILRKCEQHLDFDLELAKSRSNENPVYYIQYGHARICSVLKQAIEKGYNINLDLSEINLTILTTKHELRIMSALARYPEIIHNSALRHEPHHLAYYLRDLANEFHTYYNAYQFLVESEELRNARISLISSIKQVINNGLGILGISSPEVM